MILTYRADDYVMFIVHDEFPVRNIALNVDAGFPRIFVTPQQHV